MKTSVVAERLLLVVDQQEVSQAVPMGDDNDVKVHVWQINVGGTITSGVDVAVEGSNDLENWTGAMSLMQTLSTQIPSNDYIPTSFSSGFPFEHVRLRYKGGDAWVLLGASITTYSR